MSKNTQRNVDSAQNFAQRYIYKILNSTHWGDSVSIIYALSDIHGFYQPMLDTLSLVDLDSDKENKLLFLGDYVDRGKDSCNVLYHVKKIDEDYPSQVTVLIGNHDEMFMDWFTLKDKDDWHPWISYYFDTLKSFLGSEFVDTVKNLPKKPGSFFEINGMALTEMRKRHSDLQDWLLTKEKNRFFENKNSQIYLHAGLLEEAGDLWKQETPYSYFTQKFPAKTGPFYMDIIAGHVSSATVANNEEYLGKVYYDGKSHFYIDGETERSGIVPLLKFNTCTGVYSSFTKEIDGTWVEYQVTK